MAQSKQTNERNSLLLGGAIFFVALHLAGAILFPHLLWGVHHARYLPLPWMILLASAALFLIVPVGCRLLSRGGRWGIQHFRRESSLHRAILLLVVVGLFALFPCRNQFLGDGYLIQGLVENHDEWAIGRAGFGSLLIYKSLFRLIELISPSPVGRLPFALLNPLAGAAYLLVVFAIAREIAGSSRGRIALGSALALPGTLLFYCGYIEDYVLMHLALSGAILLMLRHLNGKGSIISSLATLGLACFLHLSASIMIPAWVIVLVMKLKTLPQRIGALALLLLAGVGAFLKLLAYVHEGYGGTGALLPLFQSGSHAYPLFSPHHFIFLINEMILLLGGALLLPLIAYQKGGGKKSKRKSREDRGVGIFLAAISAMGLAYFLLLDAKLGSRDWDLMALPVVPWIALLGWFTFRGGREPGRGAVAVITGMCLLHTLPWILVNTDRDRAVAMTLDMVSGDGHYIESGAWANRAFSYLLLQKGYTDQSAEVAERSVRVAGDARDLYNAGIAAAEKGDHQGAIRWFRSAITARPDYDLPYHDLAKLYMRQGRGSDAESVLQERLALGEEAIALYLLGLALGGQERIEESITALSRCVELDDRHAEAWSTLGVGYASLGRPAEARSALEKSLEINPDAQRVRDFLATLPAGEK